MACADDLWETTLTLGVGQARQVAKGQVRQGRGSAVKGDDPHDVTASVVTDVPCQSVARGGDILSKRKPLLHCPVCGKRHRPERRRKEQGTRERICDVCWAKAMKKKGRS
jgi:hypothetical protein